VRDPAIPATGNQNPEQLARDQIDERLAVAGWCVQDKEALNFSAGQGIAVREYQTDEGPADYVLFVDRRAVGVIEAKPKDGGHKITTVEDQSAGYAVGRGPLFFFSFRLHRTAADVPCQGCARQANGSSGSRGEMNAVQRASGAPPTPTVGGMSVNRRRDRLKTDRHAAQQ
jgi:hypothetical protein